MSGADVTCSTAECTGAIVDGYCDICGSPPGVAEPSPALSPVGEGLSTRSRASSRLGSAALGSARLAAGSQLTRRASTASQRLRAKRLGAGLTSVPPQPAVDAQKAMMTNPMLAESKRFCPSCQAPVGRSSGERPGRSEGFCPQCRNPYSFTPKLQAGDLVANQYEVAGCLAHGGLGWIYVARDRNVSDRWVVLKGLLNSGDADALAAAIAEQQTLAQVEHPSIVEIYNFVTHEGAGYIVMEYVGGTSLKSLLQNRMQSAGRYEPLPLDQAIAYILEVLPAFQYLHDLGFLYCDFKPDNIIQIGDDIKLIDLGAVRKIDDEESAIYGTVGYQAPEVAEIGPSIAADIYTIGRTLIVLAMEFRGYQSTYLNSLPPVLETELFQKYDSFYRLVAKACALDPADRFASISELRGQLLGVLREVVALDHPERATNLPTAPSVLFGPPTDEDGELLWTELPQLLPDPTDPQAGWLAGVSLADPLERLAALKGAPEVSTEILLEQGRTALAARAWPEVEVAAEALLQEDPWEWRAAWLQGLGQLGRGEFLAAQKSFNAVYGQVPGELAPKLALALACESSGELEVAQGLYEVCVRGGSSYRASAAFGIARILLSGKNKSGAVAALDLVPSVSRAWVPARLERAQILAGPSAPLADLAAALASVHGVEVDPIARVELEVNVYQAALAQVQAGGEQPSLQLGNGSATSAEIRENLEAGYRRQARLVAKNRADRVRLIDAANTIRDWSWT